MIATGGLMQRVRTHSSTTLPADQLLRLVTIEGARVLGMAERVGTLEVGKDADLCAVSLGGPAAAQMCGSGDS